MELIVEGMDITALSDEDLANRLQNLGFPTGPIVDTTRRVYQLKLARLLRNEETTASESEESEEKGGNQNVMTSFLQSENIGDSPSVSFRDNTSFDRSPSLPFRYDELKRRPLPRTSTSFASSNFRSPVSMDSLNSKVSQPSKVASSPSMFTTGVKIAVLACVLVFAFLVYRNMESGVTNPVPEFPVP